MNNYDGFNFVGSDDLVLGSLASHIYIAANTDLIYMINMLDKPR